MTDAHRRYIRVETGVSTVLNTLFCLLFGWIIFGGREQVPFAGTDGVGLDVFPTVFMSTLMTAVALTLLTRARLRKGAVLPIAGASTRLPRFFLLRAVLFGLLAALAIAAPTYLLLSALNAGEWTFGGLMLMKALFGVVIGLVATPPILRAALSDGASAPSKAAR